MVLKCVNVEVCTYVEGRPEEIQTRVKTEYSEEFQTSRFMERFEEFGQACVRNVPKKFGEAFV